MPFCFECGARLQEGSLFCPNCGTMQSRNHNGSETNATGKSTISAPKSGYYGNSFGESSRYDVQGYATMHNSNPPLQTNLGYRPEFEVPSPTEDKASSKSGKTALTIIIIVASLLLLIAIVLIVAFTHVEESSYVGYWDSTGIDMGSGYFEDEVYGNSVNGLFGLQLTQDGTAFFGSLQEGTVSKGMWKEISDGIVVYIDGKTAYLMVDDGSLIMDGGNGTYILFEEFNGNIDNPRIPFTSQKHLSDNAQPSPEGTDVYGSGYVGSGDFYVTVVGAEEIADVDGKPTVRLYYIFTNEYFEHYSADNALGFYITQDGEDLFETYTWRDDEISANAKLELRTDRSLLCCYDFNYNPQGGPLEITAFDLLEGENSHPVTTTLLPGELPGAPGPFNIEPINSPGWSLALGYEGVLDEIYGVSVNDSAELLENSEGIPSIRVYYEFTNYGTDTVEILQELSLFAYQDGIQIPRTNVSQPTEPDLATDLPVPPGATAKFSVVYELRNETSPVEADIESTQDYSAFGQTFKIN